MRVLVACERSGVVREAFNARAGCYAFSCDVLPCTDERSDCHLLCDVREILADGWDLLIAHPPCTYLATCAAWAFRDPDFKRYPGVGYHQKAKPGTLTGAKRRATRERALRFVRLLMDAPIPHICIENPVGAISTRIRKPDQIIQPWWFGDDASKATCLWLKGLPALSHASTPHIRPRMVNGRPRWGNQTDAGQNKLSPSDDRAAVRAVTYPGIARAFADQWSICNL